MDAFRLSLPFRCSNIRGGAISPRRRDPMSHGAAAADPKAWNKEKESRRKGAIKER